MRGTKRAEDAGAGGSVWRPVRRPGAAISVWAGCGRAHTVQLQGKEWETGAVWGWKGSFGAPESASV